MLDLVLKRHSIAFRVSVKSIVSILMLRCHRFSILQAEFPPVQLICLCMLPFCLPAVFWVGSGGLEWEFYRRW